MSGPGGTTAKDLAPAAEKIGAGKWREAVPLLVGVVGTALAGPLAGGLGAGGATLVAELLADSAAKRMDKEGKRIDDEVERAELITQHLIETLDAVRRLDTSRVERPVEEIGLEGPESLLEDIREMLQELLRRLPEQQDRNPDLIDFSSQANRHTSFYGRQDVLARLEELVKGPIGSGGWVLLTGGPGMGKSAILWRLLQEHSVRGQPLPHHILQRGRDWARPDVVVRSLSAQLEARYPEQADPEAVDSPSRLVSLLARLGRQGLVTDSQRLTLVVDGLDETESSAGSNPLPAYLPDPLPAGVCFVVASRPVYPHLNWFQQAGRRVQRIDLDGDEWAASNHEACQQFWQYEGAELSPPLTDKEREEVEKTGQGNLLYAFTVHGELRDHPELWRPRLSEGQVPDGLQGVVQAIWDNLAELPHEQDQQLAIEGLALVCAAREALPKSVLQTLAGWGNPFRFDKFLKATRQLLHEQPAHWRGQRAYQPFHESVREFVQKQLGDGMAQYHRRLATQLGWPVDGSADDFRRNYALAHAVTHQLAGGELEEARQLCTDVSFLQAKCQGLGPFSLEQDLGELLQAAPSDEVILLERALRLDSGWLYRQPQALPSLLHNRLRCEGLSPQAIDELLHNAPALPLVLRHPVQLCGNELRTLSGHSLSVTDCALSADGNTVLSASDDGTLKLWDARTGNELRTLSGHSDNVTACALSTDGSTVLSASDDRTLKLWDARTAPTGGATKRPPHRNANHPLRHQWKRFTTSARPTPSLRTMTGRPRTTMSNRPSTHSLMRQTLLSAYEPATIAHERAPPQHDDDIPF